MIYFISWRGRGYVAFLAIWLAAGFLALGALINESSMMVAFGIGWLVAGILCFVLGRRWNRAANKHYFGPMRLQTWGVIYGVIGVFLLFTITRWSMASRGLNKPIRLPVPAHRPS